LRQGIGGVPFDQLIVLAVIQGLTEFLPISSSGHLNLVHLLTDWQDEGPLVDVAIHVGSLGAVMLYFWRDMAMFLRAIWQFTKGRVTPEFKLLLYLIVATLPIFAVGYFVVKMGLLDDLRTAKVIAWSNMGFALVLLFCDRVGMTVQRIEHTTLGDAVLIGVAQVLSVIPGASRAGLTISMARYLGYERPEAARISMLLSIPTILGLGLATAWELQASGNLDLQRDAVLAGALSLVTALISISFMMWMAARMTLLPFVVYRIVLGGFLLGWIYASEGGLF
jgi:undecaprenyl-diphosphatase